MADEKFTYSKKYSDRCLRDMASIVLNQINKGEGDGIQMIMAMSQSMHMHPNLVVQKIQEMTQI